MSFTGQHIAHYHLLQRLKTGGMGEIYLAQDELLGRRVAIKLIEIDYSHYTDAGEANEAVRLFLREARAIGRFNHHHILHVYDVGEAHIAGSYLMYMVTPFCPEGSLSDWLRNHGFPRPLPLPHVEHIVMQAARALQHAHDHGIIHQDVKPENFLVHGRAEHPLQLHLQLADFGIAKLIRTGNESQSIRGTPFYMAPEQWEGRAVPQTDQYSLAVMTYELLTGNRPFSGNNAQQLWHQHMHVIPSRPSLLNPDIPHELDAVILQALAKNPYERFQSLSTFAKAFRKASRSNVLSPEAERDIIPPTATPAFPRTAPASPALHEDTILPPTSQEKHGISRRVVLPFILVLLLIAVSAGLFFYPHLYMVNTNPFPQETATSIAQTAASHKLSQQAATAHAQQTNIAQANATNAAATTSAGETATASAVVATNIAATATAIARVTATITAYNNSIVIGPRVLNDPLQDNSQNHNWDILSTKDARCGFSQGAYHATASAGTYSPCFAEATDFRNFSYQVETIIAEGDQAGLAFCGDSVKGNFYYFSINTRGEYALYIYQDYSPVKTLAYGTSSAINTALGQSNILAVKVINGTISLYINMQPIAVVTDSTYNEGVIGVVAEGINAPTDAAFSDAEVWQQS